MAQFQPKKWPKQARSKASFDAMLEACARILRDDGYEALSTNRIAELAGVGIGTLYDFFPDKETVVAVLAGKLMERAVSRMQEAFRSSRGMGPWPGLVHLAQEAVATIAAERTLYLVLLRQVPFVPTLPAAVAWRGAMTRLAQDIRIAAGETINLPMPETDTWLLAQMVFNAIVEIGCLDVVQHRRDALTASLARLTFRMAVGRDPMANPNAA